MEKDIVMRVLQNVSSASAMSATENTTSISAEKSPISNLCRKTYGTQKQFLSTFNPDLQLTYCRPDRLERVLLGRAPTLNVVGETYGRDCALTWMELQLTDLVNYIGCHEKVTSAMLETTAGVIVSEFGYLKVTELMLFMLRLKSGQFGSIYGKADGLRITIALREFLRYRAIAIDRIEMRRKGEMAW